MSIEIWLTVAAVLLPLALGFFFYGRGNFPEDFYSDDEPGFLVVPIIAIFWPIILGLGILIGPLWFTWWLGKRSRRNRNDT